MSSPYYVANASYSTFADQDAAVVMFGCLVFISSFSWFKGKYPFKFKNLWIKLDVPESILHCIYERRRAILGETVEMQHSPHITLMGLQYCTNYPLRSSNRCIPYGSIGKIMEQVISSGRFKDRCTNFLDQYHNIPITNNRAQGYAMLGDSETKYLAKCFTSDTSNIGKKLAEIFADEVIHCYSKHPKWTLKIRHEEFLCGKTYMGFYIDFVDKTTGSSSSISEFPAFVMPMYYYANDSTSHITIASSQEIEVCNPQLHQQMDNLSQDVKGDVVRDFLVRNTRFPSIPVFCVGDCSVVVE
jgi:hypothetical protein